MGLLGNLIKEVIAAPGVIVQAVTKESIALPGRILDGLQEGVDALLDEEEG
jgi:hypothetical protein